jgi:hypothetical protein
MLLAAAGPAAAQGRLSEKGAVSQTVGNTTVTVEYYRPVARGRDSVFGRIVRWGEHWTPGANWASTFETSRDLRVEGKLLPRGKYSIWTVVRPDTWSVAFHRTARRFHLALPDASDRALEVTSPVERGPHTEVMTFDFPEVGVGAATLRHRWGPLTVPLHLTMIAPPLTQVAKADRARYVGRYTLDVLPFAPGVQARTMVVEFTDEADGLHWRDVENPGQPRRDFILSPGGPDDEFSRAQRSADGQWWTQTGMTVTFQVANGRAMGFEVRVDDNLLVSRARRVR